MTEAQGLVTVWLHVAPEREEEFNAWYNLEHINQMVALPGVVSARRYVVEDAKPKYLAWYDVADEHFEPGPAFQEVVANPTPWSRRIRTFYGENRERMNFRLMRDVGEKSPSDTPWLYIVHTDIPDDVVGEYNEWYDNEHLPRLVTVPGVIRARRYAAVSGSPKYLTAYELTDKDAFESPAGLAARKDTVDRKDALAVSEHAPQHVQARVAESAPHVITGGSQHPRSGVMHGGAT